LIDDAGKVQDVCVGTGKNDNIEYYLARPRVPGDMHGQARVLWLVTAMLRNPAS
jgi:hypothetical protein